MPGLARAAALAVALFVVFNINLRGIGSRDTRVTEHVAFSIAAYGRADLDAFPAMHETGLAKAWLVQSGAHVRSTYPIVPAVLAAPAYGLAIAAGVLPRTDPPLARLEAVGKLAASAMTAAAGGVLFLILKRRWPDRLAAAIAAAAGLTTPLWSSASQALWSHGPAALLLAIGIQAATADDARLGVRTIGAQPRWHLAAAGLALALAVSCRPLLVFFLAGHLFSTWRARGARGCLVFATGVIAGASAVAAYNVSAFGTLAGGAAVVESAAVHQAAHDVTSAWSGNPGAGLAGILVSPSRGLVIFMPIALVALAGARDILQRRTLEVWSLVVPTGLFVLGWSMYSVWWGGHSYGPRYAADLAVPLALLAAASFHRAPQRRAAPATRALVAALLAWSLFVQAAGAFCYPGGDWNATPADVDRAHARLWDWRDSQIPRTIRAGLYRPHLDRF